MKKKPYSGKYEKDNYRSHKEIEEKQIFMNELRKDMKKEILGRDYLYL